MTKTYRQAARRAGLLSLGICLGCLPASAGGAAWAEAATADLGSVAAASTEFSPAALLPPSAFDSGSDLGARDRVILQLAGPSLWRGLESSGALRGPAAPVDSAALRAEQARIEAEHAAMRAVLQDYGVTIVGEFRVVYNGFLVDPGPEGPAILTGLPGVAGVWPAPRMHPLLRDVASTISSDRVQASLGFDGSGVTVAVIDTGVDYHHAMLGGSGDPAAHAADDEARIEPGSFPTTKVIGGFDLAGSHYSPACPEPANPRCHNLPDPDPDPLDPSGLGHGTHVAGIIAGRAAAPRLPDGIAPGASLVALKIFGDPAGASPTSDLALSALDWVVGHNLGLAVPGSAPPGPIQIVNLSLGTDWSARMIAIEEAVAEVVESGVTVVASAGNAGALGFVTGSPGSAGMALSVASSVPEGEYRPRLDATWRGADGRPQTAALDAIEGSSDWLPRVLDLDKITADLVWIGSACGADPGPRIEGAVALIERGGCTFYDKLIAAERLGAVAAVVVTDGAQKSVMGCDQPSDCQRAPGIPSLMIDRAPGIALRDRITLGESVRVVIEAERLRYLDDTVSDFSSRGPARFNAAIKPQLTAPGSNVSSALAGSGRRLVEQSGTSMAGPAVAGAAALVWQRSQARGLGLSAADVAAMLMNHADPGLHIGRSDSGPSASIMRQGAGRLDAMAAVTADTLVRSDIGIAALSFGMLHLNDSPAQARRSLRVRNLGQQTRHYLPTWRLAFPGEDGATGVDLRFVPERFSLEPGQEIELDVTLRVDPTRLRPWQLRGAEPVRNEEALQALEIDGYITLEPLDVEGRALAGADRANLPFYVLPRRHGCLESRSTEAVQFWEEGERAPHRWQNLCGQAGKVEVFGLLGQDAAESRASENFPSRLDVEALGLRYGPAVPGDMGSMLLSFALRTRGSRRIPGEAEIRVYLDLDRDGSFDRVLFTRYGQAYDARLAEGRWVVVAASLRSGELWPDRVAALGDPAVQLYDLDETTTVLSVSAEALGIDLSRGTAAFDAAVIVQDAVGDFPLLRDFPGYDLAPDGLLEGEVYHFDQRAWSCVSLVDAEGKDLATIGSSLSIAGASEASGEFRLLCPVDQLPESMGVLLHYPENRPGEQVELRRILAAVPPPIPSAEPTPSLVPTDEPGLPSQTPVGASPTPEPSAGPTMTQAAAPTTTATTATAGPPGEGLPRAGDLRVLQSRQLADASLPLVAGRPSLLRVRVEGPDSLRVSGRLEARHAGDLLPGSPLRPSNPGRNLLLGAADPDRELAGSLNFELPTSWAKEGLLDLKLELLLADEPKADPVQTVQTQARFRNSELLSVVLVPVEWQPGGLGPKFVAEADGTAFFALDRVLRSFPAAGLDLRWHAPLRFDGALQHAAGQRALLHQLARMRLVEIASAGGHARLDAGQPASPAPIYLALLPEAAGSGLAEAYQGGGVAAVTRDRPALAARALGLALGMNPAASTIGCGPGSHPGTGLPGPADSFGLDLFTRQLKSAGLPPMMSGCENSWIDAQEWSALFDRLVAAGAAAESSGSPDAEPVESPAWLVTGRLDAAGERAWLDQPQAMDGARTAASEGLQPAPGGAGLTLESLGAGGKLLARWTLRPTALVEAQGESPAMGFGLVLPQDDAMLRLRLVDARGVSLAERTMRPAGAFSLAQVLLPPGSAEPGIARLFWQARRSGKPEPAAGLSLRLSRDGGQSWQSLAIDARDARLPLPLESMGLARAGLLESTVSLDGDRDRMIERIGPQRDMPPTVGIAGPAFIQRQVAEPILLEGAASDREDGALSGEALRWSLSEIDLERMGGRLSLPSGLPSGRYTAVLEARDSGGRFDLASILIQVGAPAGPTLQPLYLPGLFQRRR